MPLSIDVPPAPVTRRAALVGVLAMPAIIRARAASTKVLKVTAYDGFVPPAIKTQFENESGAVPPVSGKLPPG
jgi:spermidine/putrescine-binding protein